MTGEQKNSFVSALTTTMMLPHILPNNFDAFQKNLKRHTQFHISDEVAKCRSNKYYRVNNNSVNTKLSEVLNWLHAQSMKNRKRNTPAFSHIYTSPTFQKNTTRSWSNKASRKTISNQIWKNSNSSAEISQTYGKGHIRFSDSQYCGKFVACVEP